MSVKKQPMAGQALITLAVVGTLSACGGGNNDNPPVSGGSSPTPVQIDATAGGFGAAIDDPANKYTYFHFKTGEVVALTDAQADTSNDWHIAFKRTAIKLNGGASGPGSVSGALADAQNDFYDAATGDPDNSVFLNASANSELAAFNAVTNVNGLAFAEDRNIPYIKGDGTDAGWWLYSGPPAHTVSANPDQWWLIKSAAADSYAKFNVTNIVQTSRDITLNLFIQSTADNTFSTTASPWTAAIGSAGGSKCFDIDSIAEVDCTTATTHWDIKVEVAGQAWNIWTNGGVSGSGNGGAFGPFNTAAIANYVSGQNSPGGTNITEMYEQDSSSGLFKDNTWYAYSLEGNSKLWPNYRVYAIDTDTGFYKVQLLSYYDQAGVSGNYTLRYTPLAEANPASIVTVALTEWAVTPDKNTVNAGPVTFNAINDGPVDVHELVIIKTDLAADSLPVDGNGNVDINGANIILIGAIKNIAVGADAQATFDLEPGNYVLVCNIWDAGEQEAHYAEGMRVAFTVQ
ncbi:MAG: HmuY family protein [Gammaproteobacteria bacterium]|nr:HmuY family protein [Gammaproteobacteria bacterium]